MGRIATLRVRSGTLSYVPSSPFSKRAGVFLTACATVNICQFWNLMDYPAITFPVTKGSSSVDVIKERPTLQSDVDKAIWEACESGLPALMKFCD